MSVWSKFLSGAVSGLLGLYIACCLILYALSAHLSPDVLPSSDYRAPAALQAQFLAVEAPGARALPKLDPFTFWPRFFVQADRPPQAEWQLLHRATQLAQFRPAERRSMSEHHLSALALTIRLSRQWSREDAVNTLLAESRFGRDAVGVEQAAQRYFGVDAAALRPQESLALFTLMHGPGWFRIDCGGNRERFARRYRFLADRLGAQASDWTPEQALARLRPWPCARA